VVIPHLDEESGGVPGEFSDPPDAVAHITHTLLDALDDGAACRG
jgi:hypothetical protein